MSNTIKGAIQVLYVDRILSPGKVSSKFYNEIDDLFCDFSEFSLKALFGDFGSLYMNVSGETKAKLGYRFRYESGDLNAVHYMAVDCAGRYISPDRLVGLYREWRKSRISYYRRAWHSSRDRGKKLSVYGGYRHIKTTQERRMAFIDPDGAEIGLQIKPRGSRNKASLPTAWDDIWAGNQKCWKKQSKRVHQWKQKTSQK